MNSIEQTERLILRNLEVHDAADLEAIWGDSEVMCYCGGALKGHQRLLRSVQYYETINAIGGLSVYAVMLKDTGDMIGVCGFNSTEKPGVYELIFHFKKESWGKGYATEACQSVISMISALKATRNIVKLIASMAPENSRSGRVLEKCGFKFTGETWFEDTQRYEPTYERYL